MPLVSAAIVVVGVLLVSVQAVFSGTDSTGAVFNYENVDFDFQYYNYSVSATVLKATFSPNCVVNVEAKQANQIVFVDWPLASGAGCSYFINVVTQYTSSQIAIPSVLVFSSTKPQRPGLTEPYRRGFYNTGNDPKFNNPGLSLTILAVADAAALAQLSFPLNASISSNLSLDTIEITTPQFKALVWILVCCFLLIFLYCSCQVVILWYRRKGLVLNTRVVIYLGLTVYSFCRFISESVDYFSFKGIISYTGTFFLLWFSLLAVYLSFCSLVIAWADIVTKELGYSSNRWVGIMPRITIYITIALFVALVILEVLNTETSSVQTVFLVFFILLLPTLVFICACCLFYGIKILMTLSAVHEANQPNAVIRTITILMFAMVFVILSCIVIVLIASISNFNDAHATSTLIQALSPFIALDCIFIFFSLFTCVALFSNTFGSPTAHTSTHSSSRHHPNSNGSRRESAAMLGKVPTSPSNLKIKEYLDEDIERQHVPSVLLATFAAEVDATNPQVHVDIDTN